MTLSSLTLCASLALGALTPAKVDNVKTSSNAPSHQPPTIIYVDRFSTQDVLDKATSSSLFGSGDSDDDNGGGGGRPHLFGSLRGGEQNTLIGQHRQQQQYDLLQKLPGVLQKTLVQSLNQGVARATVGDGTLATELNCWVIRGQFVVVDQGSRAMQAGVGFGAGQSHVEIHAQVYTLSDPDKPFLTFDTKGASGHMPGAVVMMNPYAAAAKFVMGKKEPEKETKKIGKQIAEEIGKFMMAQNIPTLKAMKASGMTPPPPAPDYPQTAPIYSSKGTSP